MASLAASLALQIDAIDAKMSAISPTSVGADGATVTNPDWIALSNHRIKLDQMLARASGTSPRIIRGVVKGL